MTFAHVLLTRFNLPTGGAESFVRAKEGWLRDRIQLFETYTVPSVKAQADTVHWLVYVDPQSPGWLMDRLRPLVDEQLLCLEARDGVTKSDLLRDVHRVIPADATRVVTTNLDNDDGLGRDFSTRVRAAAAQPGTAAIYVDRGLVVTEDAVYSRRDPSNAFCSVVADVGVDVSCWEDWHNRLHLHMQVRHVTGGPGWLQTVHGGNVSNRVRGRRVSPSGFHANFPGLLERIPEPGLRNLASDALGQRPVRALRDTARVTTRSLAVRALGKERFNQVKGVFAGWRAE